MKRPCQIIYQDDSFLIVDKPSGHLTYPSELDRNAPDLLSELQQLLQLKLAPLQRLDRATSGLLIYTKNKQTTQIMQQDWSASETIKLYLCLARGNTDESFESSRPLTDRKTQTLKEAHTSFKKIKNYQRSTLLEAKLMTGRTHQIRRHLAHLGHHLIGDTTYGKGGFNSWARESGLARLFLHCHQLTIIHPYERKLIEFRCPLPPALQEFLKNIELDA